MKKLITVMMMALSLAACSSDLNAPDGKTYHPYGLLNNEKASEKVCYNTNVSDVILGIVFIESVIVPIYTFGFDVKEPKGMKKSDGTCN